jgi:beta-glucosidase
MDLTMPGFGMGGTFGLMWGPALLEAVNNGSVPMSRLDDAVRAPSLCVQFPLLTYPSQVTRVLTPWIAFGDADHPPPPVTWNAFPSSFTVANASWHDVRKPATMDLIRQIGEDSATLLKNTNGALPLKNPKVLAIIGSDAGPNALSGLNAGGENHYPVGNVVSPCSSRLHNIPQIMTQNGTLSLGGGSGWAIPPYLVTPYESIAYRARKMNSQVYSVFNDTAYNEAGMTVQVADTALVFVRAFAVEGRDRANLLL